MHDDRHHIRELREDQAQQDVSEKRTEPEASRRRVSPAADRSDSQQAQENLERMLETGEENPV